jgi:cilla- and flagella-associated protein
MYKKLTLQLVRARTKNDNLSLIRQFNLVGNEVSDVSIISEMASIQVISLSVNKISSLEAFAGLQHLKSLYLRNNNIASLEEVLHLQNCPALKTLWLYDNPVAGVAGYRLFTIRALP